MVLLFAWVYLFLLSVLLILLLQAQEADKTKAEKDVVVPSYNLNDKRLQIHLICFIPNAINVYHYGVIRQDRKTKI